MLSAVPQSVIDQVKHLIQILEALTIARQTDITFNGQGRYEAEAYVDRMVELEAAWRGIAAFEQLCENNGVNFLITAASSAA